MDVSTMDGDIFNCPFLWRSTCHNNCRLFSLRSQKAQFLENTRLLGTIFPINAEQDIRNRHFRTGSVLQD